MNEYRTKMFEMQIRKALTTSSSSVEFACENEYKIKGEQMEADG